MLMLSLALGEAWTSNESTEISGERDNSSHNTEASVAWATTLLMSHVL